MGWANLTLRRALEGEEQQVQEGGWWKQCRCQGSTQQPLQGTAFAQITLY